LMLLTYEFNGACSIELFRPNDRWPELQQAGYHSQGCSLKYLSPILKWSKWLIYVVPHAAVDKEVAWQEQIHTSRATLHKSNQKLE